MDYSLSAKGLVFMFRKCLALILVTNLALPSVSCNSDAMAEAVALERFVEVGLMAGGLPGALVGAAVGAVGIALIAAVGGEVAEFAAEHTKGKRPSTKGKHEKGQARKDRDAGREKGDKRRDNPWGRW